MPRPTRTEERARMNLDVPLTVRELIQLLVIKLEADSMTEVIRRSINFYREVFCELQEGTTFWLCDANGLEKKMLFTQTLKSRKEKRVRMNLDVPLAVREKIQKLAEETDVNMTKVIRRAVETRAVFEFIPDGSHIVMIDVMKSRHKIRFCF